jgi:hypothetical protein
MDPLQHLQSLFSVFLDRDTINQAIVTQASDELMRLYGDPVTIFRLLSLCCAFGPVGCFS